MDKHLQRLSNGLQKIRLEFGIELLHDAIEELLRVSNLEDTDALVYIQITRGVAQRKHNFPGNTTPTLMLYALPKSFPPINTTEVRLRSFADFRWHRCDIKSISLLGNVMANDEAIEADTHEAIFERDGIVTEGSHSNIFFVKDQVVFTHPADQMILNGVTRQTVIQLCSELGIDVKEQGISKDEIHQMDESFITGTTTQIAAVKQIDQHEFKDDNYPGMITQQLQKAFARLKWERE